MNRLGDWEIEPVYRSILDNLRDVNEAFSYMFTSFIHYTVNFC